MGGVCESCGNGNNQPKFAKGTSFVRCTYDIKDYNETQIINDRGRKYINEEIGAKIKIWNNGNKERLIFKKKFNKLGLNTIDFIFEEKLINMSYMFNECSSLKHVQFFSGELLQATKIGAMFQMCSELECIDLTNFNTSNVDDMGWMCYGCKKLKQIRGINNFNTMKVNNMCSMFAGCEELEYLDLSNFNTSNVTDMSYMFDGCHKIKEIKGINNFNTIFVTNMCAMFQECFSLENLDLSKFNTSHVTDMSWMFNKCNKLKQIKGIDNFNTINVIKMNSMFQECNNLV